MPNYYTLFSERVHKLQPGERQWLERALSYDVADEGDLARLCEELGADPDEAPDGWPDFEYEFEDDALLVYSEGTGSLENVASLVQAFLARFRPDRSWSMTWAETCSQPREGAFGGGCALVTATGSRWLDTYAQVTHWQKGVTGPYAVLPGPLDVEELALLREELDTPRLSAVVAVRLGDLLGLNSAGFADLLSALFTGTEDLVDVTYEVTGSKPETDEIHIRVYGDVSKILAGAGKS